MVTTTTTSSDTMDTWLEHMIQVMTMYVSPITMSEYAHHLHVHIRVIQGITTHCCVVLTTEVKCGDGHDVPCEYLLM